MGAGMSLETGMLAAAHNHADQGSADFQIGRQPVRLIFNKGCEISVSPLQRRGFNSKQEESLIVDRMAAGFTTLRFPVWSGHEYDGCDSWCG